jgi:hypothetical protein
VCKETDARLSICWTVDARKLRGNDKQVVSPPFDVFFGPQFPGVPFKLMIYPKASHESRGGSAFKKSAGRGYIQLKCEGDVTESVAEVRFSLSIGNESATEETRGPVAHNFAKGAVCGLPRSQEDWDFNTVVDQDTMTFLVVLELQANLLAP